MSTTTASSSTITMKRKAVAAAADEDQYQYESKQGNYMGWVMKFLARPIVVRCQSPVKVFKYGSDEALRVGLGSICDEDRTMIKSHLTQMLDGFPLVKDGKVSSLLTGEDSLVFLKAAEKTCAIYAVDRSLSSLDKLPEKSTCRVAMLLQGMKYNKKTGDLSYIARTHQILLLPQEEEHQTEEEEAVDPFKSLLF